MEVFLFFQGINLTHKLIRFPIIESEFKPYRWSVLSDSLANKGILYAKVKIKDSYVYVFNTHLQASYFGSSEYLWNISVKTRMDHINELCNFVRNILREKEEEIRNTDSSILIMGDFNVDAHNYEKKKQVH